MLKRKKQNAKYGLNVLILMHFLPPVTRLGENFAHGFHRSAHNCPESTKVCNFSVFLCSSNDEALQIYITVSPA